MRSKADCRGEMEMEEEMEDSFVQLAVKLLKGCEKSLETQPGCVGEGPSPGCHQGILGPQSEHQVSN